LRYFGEPVEKLRKSQVYPYGLTGRMIETLQQAGYANVKQLSEASDEELDKLPWVGTATVQRMKNVVGQAIWL
jgi:DNA-directed RNA polymerase alpha subunit